VAATNGSCGTCPGLTWSFLLPILLTPAHNYVCVGGGGTQVKMMTPSLPINSR
jgi:hypothetical protein